LGIDRGERQKQEYKNRQEGSLHVRP
jgi:hypothetical protein